MEALKQDVLRQRELQRKVTEHEQNVLSDMDKMDAAVGDACPDLANFSAEGLTEDQEYTELNRLLKKYEYGRQISCGDGFSGIHGSSILGGFPTAINQKLCIRYQVLHNRRTKRRNEIKKKRKKARDGDKPKKKQK